MATRRSKPISASLIKDDRAALVALRQQHDYAPVNEELSVASLTNLEVRLREAEEHFILASHAKDAAQAARDAVRAEFHDGMLGVKVAVKAQYGPDSDQLQALGLKKKSNYRLPARRMNGNA